MWLFPFAPGPADQCNYHWSPIFNELNHIVAFPSGKDFIILEYELLVITIIKNSQAVAKSLAQMALDSVVG